MLKSVIGPPNIGSVDLLTLISDEDRPQPAGRVSTGPDQGRIPSIQTAVLRVSAIRVCQPGPVAFQRARVSGGSRREMEVRQLNPIIQNPPNPGVHHRVPQRLILKSAIDGSN